MELEIGSTGGNLEIGGDVSVDIPEVFEIDIVNDLKKGKYEYVPLDELEWAYEKALHIYLSRVFPFNYDIVDIPEDRPRDKIWVKRCMIEILAMNDIIGDMPLQSYSENGMKFVFDASGLSKSLLEDLPPPVAIVRGKRK